MPWRWRRAWPRAAGTAARAKLRAVWEAVAKAGVPDLLRINPWLAGISRSQTLAQVASLFSPYDFNPLGFDPLRKLLEAHIDFALLRTSPGPELLIAATDVATGRPRLFRRRELTVECVLASACLPTLHHAVSIDGRAYWDGGFSANPDLITLARESPVADTLIVKLNPMIAGERAHQRARDQRPHQPHHLQSADAARRRGDREHAQKQRRRWSRRANAGDARLARHRFHLIEAGRFTSALSPESKVKPDLELLDLPARRRPQPRPRSGWRGAARPVGRRGTVDLGRAFPSAAGVPGCASKPADPPEAAA